MKHCLDFELTRCSAVCQANGTVSTCQQAVQQLCDTLTRPAGSSRRRWLAEEEVKRQLVDTSCASSPAFLTAIREGVPLIVVGQRNAAMTSQDNGRKPRSDCGSQSPIPSSPPRGLTVCSPSPETVLSMS